MDGGRFPRPRKRGPLRIWGSVPRGIEKWFARPGTLAEEASCARENWPVSGFGEPASCLMGSSVGLQGGKKKGWNEGEVPGRKEVADGGLLRPFYMGRVRLWEACPISPALQRSVAALGFGGMTRGGRRKTPAPAKRRPREGLGNLPHDFWIAASGRGGWY